jgi:ribosomal protein S18 acetylase RimI-like enzyme
VVEVQEVGDVSAEIVAAFNRLIPQLSATSLVPTADQLRRIVESDGTVLFVARENGKIVGSLTLVVVRIPTGVRARIEDVVVDEAVRGRGVGARLSQVALERAAAEGAKTVDLTSRPTRTAANRLYERLGFHERETKVYRYKVG